MSLADYFGRFHPALVHIPIGVFLGIILLECLALKPKFKNLLPATRVLLMLGFVSASVAALAGYLHSRAESFDEAAVNLHLVLGIGVAVVSFVAIILNGGSGEKMRNGYYASLAVLGLMTVLAGHTGASITYGAEYLYPSNMNAVSGDQYSDISKETLLYAGLVKPTFDNKCVGCHGPSRQKGKLRLDAPEYIRLGGEDGEIVNMSLPEEGELWRRITLESSNDDHMPPIEKPQLSATEIGLITFWLENGADFNSTLGSFPKSDSIIAVLTKARPVEKSEDAAVPLPNEDILNTLRKNGVAISFLSKDDGRIALQFINAKEDSMVTLLETFPSLKAQVVEIKLPNQRLRHEDWKKMGLLTNLRKLSAENSNLSDDDVGVLQDLMQLEYLNLVGTAVTASGLSKISLPGLKHLYLFKTAITPGDVQGLKQQFPNAELILGNFQVPTFESDTTERKEKYVVPVKE